MLGENRWFHKIRSLPAHRQGHYIVSSLCSGELSQMDAMHLHVLLYKSKVYLFWINYYLFIMASYESCFYELYCR